MLRKTLNTNKQIDITRFLNLKAILKNNAKGYKPVKSLIFSWDGIKKFISEADDQVHLASKVKKLHIFFISSILIFTIFQFLESFQIILIFGISGAMKCDELVNLCINDVEDTGSKFIISIQGSKNDYDTGTITASRQFVIGKVYYNNIKKYMQLRSEVANTDRFFFRYYDGKCTKQQIGINKIYNTPRMIATFLNLPNKKKYTGHCFRRTGASLLANSGANFTKVRQLGGWTTDKTTHGYVENSMATKNSIFHGIIQHDKTLNSSIEPQPSTSGYQSNKNQNLHLHATNHIQLQPLRQYSKKKITKPNEI